MTITEKMIQQSFNDIEGSMICKNNVNISDFVKRTTIIENKRQVSYLDLNNNIEYDILDIPYDKACHGLCEKYGKPVYKLSSDRVVIVPRINPKEISEKSKIVYFHLNDKSKKQWLFEPLEISLVKEAIKEGLDERHIAIRVGAPIEAIDNLLIDIGGERNVVKRNIEKRKRISNRISTTRTRKNAN